MMKLIAPKPITLLILALLLAPTAQAANIFIRIKLTTPAQGTFKLNITGHRHAGEPWGFPEIPVKSAAGVYTNWIDLSKWPWHGKIDRAGGLAEWPSLKISATAIKPAEVPSGRAFEVQLAESPDEDHIVHTFTEKTESITIGFIVPNPLKEHAAEFETGSQMTARQLKWANEVTNNKPITLKQFTIATSLWGPYDPALAKQNIQTLRQLGFNILGGTDADLIAQSGARTARQSWLFNPDPEKSDKDWKHEADRITNAQKTEEGRRELATVAHWVLGDEIRALDLKPIDPAKRDAWFRDYLHAQKFTDADFGSPIDQATFPPELVHLKSLPRDADEPTRRLMYYAAKFNHHWSAQQLRHSTDLIHASLPNMPTETLPTDHGFFNAWGPPTIGMSAPLLDLFEIANQQSVDQLSSEDWLGLNHMYGPSYTWTGAQSFEYFAAIMRSAIADRPILLRSLITPSDDNYLRLKAYSALGQGVKSFFFWTFGPTYIGTENYWSDLKSEYAGIAKLNRALEQAEPILHPAKPVHDPVAILYSVSHDIWHSDEPAAFVEKRLLWHALRHLQIQPDFIREEDAARPEFLAKYKALYIADWCITRAASDNINNWVKAGGVLYLSAGAATRDEFFNPYIPDFAKTVWPENAAEKLISEKHTYNERTDLPNIKPLTRAIIKIEGTKPFELPVLGCRLNLRNTVEKPLAVFEDKSPAAAIAQHGEGQVIAIGFMPILAYAQQANFKPKTLEEKWPAAPRELIKLPLTLAKITPIAAADEPVVEASLLTGPNGSALILANYTYKPIKSLTIDLQLSHSIIEVISTEGRPVSMDTTKTGIRLELPLEWTDIILLRKR